MINIIFGISNLLIGYFVCDNGVLLTWLRPINYIIGILNIIFGILILFKII